MIRLRRILAAEQLAARRDGFRLATDAMVLEREGAADSIMCRLAWLGVILCDLRAALLGYRGPQQYDTFGPLGRYRPDAEAR